MPSTIISFVRHGEVYNPHNIYYGRLPRFHLSENGRNQAVVTAQHLQKQSVTVIYSSPMLRTRQTAQIIADYLGLSVHRSARLIETHTPFDGQPSASLEATDWDVYTDTPAEYEQPADVVARLTSFIQVVRRKHNSGHIVAVTHGDPIAFTALWAADQPIAVPGRKQLRRVGLTDDFPSHAAILSLSFGVNGERPYQINYQNPPSESKLNRAG